MTEHKFKTELTEEEIFELARERFLASIQLDEDAINAAIQLNKELRTLSVEELFRQFTI